MKSRNTSFRCKRLAMAVAATAAITASLNVSADDAQLQFELKKQSLNSALMTMGEQSGVQIAIRADAASSVDGIELKGTYTLAEALDRVLAGTDLQYSFASENLVLITESDDSAEEDSEADSDDVEEVVVTGSRLITNPAKLTRQTTTIDRAEIERSGATRLDEFLRRLPQNVNAPSNFGSGFVDGANPDFGLGTNVFSGSSANLRGLGSQYTLILVDGRRPPAGGQFGGITDISNIPLERIERIEILFDGAAAIYGADAVGGVINVITNREFEGTNVNVGYSATEDGGGTRYNFSLGHTFNWDSGSMTAQFTYGKQGAIDGAERDLPIIDQVQLRVPASSPGNVVGRDGLGNAPLMYINDLNGDGDTLDPGERVAAGRQVVGMTNNVESPGVNVPWTVGVELADPRISRGLNVDVDPAILDQIRDDYAALNVGQPGGYTAVTALRLPEYNGQPLGLYDIPDENLGFEALLDQYVQRQGQSFTPGDETFGLSLAFNQQFSETLDGSLSLSYSETEKDSNTANPGTVVSVGDQSLSNPFGVDFRYGWLNELPQAQRLVDQSSASISGDLVWQATDNWQVTLGFGLGKNENTATIVNQLLADGSALSRLPADVQNQLFTLQDIVNGYDEVTERDGRTVIGREQVQLGGNFNDPLTGFASPEEQALAVINPLTETTTDVTSRDIDLSLQGALFEMPAGDVMTNVRLYHRSQSIESRNNNPELTSIAVVNTGLREYGFETRQDTNGIAAEVSVPLIGGGSELPLVEDLLMSLSGSAEEYSNIDESSFNWQAGFNWGVNDWMTVRLNSAFSASIPDSAQTSSDVLVGTSTRISVYPDYQATRAVGVTVPGGYYTLSGATENLKPEENQQYSIGFIFTPTFMDGLDLQFNFVDSETVDVIGGNGIRVVQSQLAGLFDTNVAGGVHPLWYRPSEEIIGINQVVRSENLTVDPGDLVLDQRYRNTGSIDSQYADMELRYNMSNDWGEWLFVWRHQYTHRRGVLRDDTCAAFGCSLGTNPRLADPQLAVVQETVDTIDRRTFQFSGEQALPRNRGSVELNWGYRGLSVNLATVYQEETSAIFSSEDNAPGSDAVNIWRVDSQAAEALDLGLMYDFSGDLFDAPEWLSSTRVSLTINDLWRNDESQDRVELQQEYDDISDQNNELNRFTLDPRGRSFTLNVVSTF